jgi:hypothetical protein
MQGWANVKQASEYAGICDSTLRKWLKQGLQYSQLATGTILIKYDYIDEYLEQFCSNNNQVDNLVNEITKGLK